MPSDNDSGESVGPEAIPSDKYKLAYEAATHALSQQDVTLTNIRNRTTGLITIAALIGSFPTFFGLGAKGHPLPVWLAITVIVFIFVILVCAIYVLWPVTWTFGPDPKGIIESDQQDYRLTWALAKGMIDHISTNEGMIRCRGKVFSVSVALLGLEAAFVVSASLASR
jgi:hypothetical protein